MKRNKLLSTIVSCQLALITINVFGGLEVTKISGIPTTNVVIKQTKQDGSGCTSIRYTSNKSMITDTRTGDSIPVPFRAPDRDLGQTFKAPSDMTIDAIVIRVGPTAETAALIGAHISLQLLEVSGKESLHTMGTNTKTDDYTTGEVFKHILVARGGVIPSGIKANDYLKFDLTGTDELQLIGGKQYAFMLMLDNIAGSDVKLCLANTFMASTSYPNGHGIRREGGCGNPNAPEYSPDFCSFDKRLQRAPSTFGHPDVCTYRDLVFFLIKKTDNNPLPTVTITSPVNNSSFNVSDNITITANATDNGSISKVEFYQNSIKLGEDNSSPYTYSWLNVLEGNYSLTAKAFDNLNATKISDPINISVISSGSTSIKVEAENFSSMYGIKTETTTDVGGGKNVGYIESNDWMEYQVNIATAGTYTVEYRVSSKYTTGKLQLMKRNSILNTVSIPNTGNWQTWTTISSTVSLDAGIQKIRVFSLTGGWNINWFKLTLNNTSLKEATYTTSINQIPVESELSIYPIPTEGIFTVKGIGLNHIIILNETGNVIQDLKVTTDVVELDISNEAAGNYLIQVSSMNGTITKKVLKQ